ncbi:MAG: glycosyltransferase [Ferruginibacter sp.]
MIFINKLSDKNLHIITHDIPLPANYGGVVDLFFKITSLHGLGVKIHLHCYHSGKQPQPELLKYCESVDYYPRKKNAIMLFHSVPYIVQSRNDRSLLENLKKDDHPILMEGIHCTYLLKNGSLKGRKIYVRLHNVEYRYYQQLAKHESNILKKIYYRFESYLLKNYEKSIAPFATFFAVSKMDAEIYRREFNCRNIEMLPVFIPWNKVNSQPGKGSFCLYHGNLSINENEKAADWLLNNVFNMLEIPFVVAGKDPSLPLQSLAHNHSYTCMVVNPSDSELQDLVQKAQINILPSFNVTGVKLKLLNALYNGRHCIVNRAGAEGTETNQLCSIAESADDFKKLIQLLFDKEFGDDKITARNEHLQAIYDNEKNARQLISWIY